MALDLATKILGGEGANRLHRVLRSERGLTYGASADFNALKQTGDIVAQTNTRSETTGETLRLMIDEFWRLIRDQVGDRELAGAQEYLTGSFPLTIETPSQIALQILNAVFFGLNMNDLQTYRERVSRGQRGRRAARGAELPASRSARPSCSSAMPPRSSSNCPASASTSSRSFRRRSWTSSRRTCAEAAAPHARRLSAGGAVSGGGKWRRRAATGQAHRGNPAKTLLDKAIAAKGGLAKLQVDQDRALRRHDDRDGPRRRRCRSRSSPTSSIPSASAWTPTCPAARSRRSTRPAATG